MAINVGVFRLQGTNEIMRVIINRELDRLGS